MRPDNILLDTFRPPPKYLYCPPTLYQATKILVLPRSLSYVVYSKIQNPAKELDILAQALQAELTEEEVEILGDTWYVGPAARIYWYPIDQDPHDANWTWSEIK